MEQKKNLCQGYLNIFCQKRNVLSLNSWKLKILYLYAGRPGRPEQQEISHSTCKWTVGFTGDWTLLSFSEKPPPLTGRFTTNPFVWQCFFLSLYSACLLHGEHGHTYICKCVMYIRRICMCKGEFVKQWYLYFHQNLSFSKSY